MKRQKKVRMRFMGVVKNREEVKRLRSEEVKKLRR
jgi:hypothetical protein